MIYIIYYILYIIYYILYIIYILCFIVFIQLPPRPRIQDVQYLAEHIKKYGFVRKCGTPNVMFIKSIIIVPMKKNVIFIRICWRLNPFLEKRHTDPSLSWSSFE